MHPWTTPGADLEAHAAWPVLGEWLLLPPARHQTVPVIAWQVPRHLQLAAALVTMHAVAYGAMAASEGLEWLQSAGVMWLSEWLSMLEDGHPQPRIQPGGVEPVLRPARCLSLRSSPHARERLAAQQVQIQADCADVEEAMSWLESKQWRGAQKQSCLPLKVGA